MNACKPTTNEFLRKVTSEKQSQTQSDYSIFEMKKARELSARQNTPRFRQMLMKYSEFPHCDGTTLDFTDKQTLNVCKRFMPETWQKDLIKANLDLASMEDCRDCFEKSNF